MADDGLTTHGQRTRAAILAHGVELWRQGEACVTASAIGKRLGLTHSAVLYHFANVETLRMEVAAEAVRIGDKEVVPRLIVSTHPAAAGLSSGERARYLAGC